MKKYIYPALCGAIIFLAAALTFAAFTSNRLSSEAMAIPIVLTGEYRTDGGEWQPITQSTRFNALDGDLYLRGHFNTDIPDTLLHFYLDHIYFSLSVNGKEVYQYMPKYADNYAPYTCALQWSAYATEPISADDLIEIRLTNIHSAGNRNAYQDFCTNIYIGSDTAFNSFILNAVGSRINSLHTDIGEVLNGRYILGSRLWRASSIAVLIISLILLGVALTDTMQGALFGSRLWAAGLLAAFTGGSMLLSTPDVSLWSTSLLLNTYISQLCNMLSGLFVLLFGCTILSGKAKRLVLCTAAALGATDAVLMLLCFAQGVQICSFTSVWLLLQALSLMVLFICCVRTFFTANSFKLRAKLAAMLILLTAALAEASNSLLGLWETGIVLRVVFLVIFAVYLVLITKDIPATYRAARRASQLEAELVQSRISIMISQVQPHFLYNSLLGIKQLCDTDPVRASEALEHFSYYLRSNLDSLSSAQLITFDKELAHIRDYLYLEQMRFPKKLHIEWQLGCTDFMLPPLTIQPLVENAVRYGILKKKGGGTLTISSKKVPCGTVITIKDDGVGFDTAMPPNDERTHIGIENVRLRIKAQCGGTLTVESAVGTGTTATITIPKEVKH